MINTAFDRGDITKAFNLAGREHGAEVLAQAWQAASSRSRYSPPPWLTCGSCATRPGST